MSARALSPDRVLCVMMPDPTTPPQEMEDAHELAHELGVEHMSVDIDPVLDAFRQKLGGDVRSNVLRRKSAPRPQPDAHRRIEMAAGDVAHRVDHGEHRQTEGQRHAD